MTAFWIGFNRLRDRDVDFSDAHPLLKMSNDPLWATAFWIGSDRLRDRDVDFLDALQYLKMRYF